MHSRWDDYLLQDRDGSVISVPNILCKRCQKICLRSRLLNDPTLWFGPAKPGEKLENTHSEILYENWGHYESINDVKVFSLQGCHLCTLFLSILQKERPKHLENAILSEASMALLRNKFAETGPRPNSPTSETITHPRVSLHTEDNVGLIRQSFPNTMKDDL